MTNATSITFQKSSAPLRTVGRAIWCSFLTALPLCGLVLFFEMTRPAKDFNDFGFSATRMVSIPPEQVIDPGMRPWLHDHRSIARIKGVSAQRRPDKAEQASLVVTASDAERALSGTSFAALNVGFNTEFLTQERHRIALLIVSREPITDRAIPDNARLMQVTETSTSNVISFVWGRWLYKAEIEDRGVEPEVVVQKVL